MGGKESPILGKTVSLPPVFLRTKNGEILCHVRVEESAKAFANPKSELEDKRHIITELSKDNRKRGDSKDTAKSLYTVGRSSTLQFFTEGAQGVERN